MNNVSSAPQEPWRQTPLRIFCTKTVAWPLWSALVLFLSFGIYLWLVGSFEAGGYNVALSFTVYMAGMCLLLVFWVSRVLATNPVISSHDWIVVIFIFY